jgi:formylglycine-generating enzyme required for sulfatase activity
MRLLQDYIPYRHVGLALGLWAALTAHAEAQPTPAAPSKAAYTTTSAAKTLPDGTPIAPCEEPPVGMTCIPGGAFIRGADDGPENARPASTVWLQTFYIDTNELTNEAYWLCRDANKCQKRAALYNDFSRPRQPVTGVSWATSVGYCAWAGKHLPTEAQWEKAARGTDGARTPFGNEPVTCEQAIIEDKRGRSCGVKKAKVHPDVGRTFEIGSRPPGIYGLYDMAGNAWEWVVDWESKSWKDCGEACAGVDPKGPCAGAEACPGHKERVVRGGSWYWKAPYAMSYFRRTHDPKNEISNFHHFGFRCAASIDEARALRNKPK